MPLQTSKTINRSRFAACLGRSIAGVWLAAIPVYYFVFESMFLYEWRVAVPMHYHLFALAGAGTGFLASAVVRVIATVGFMQSPDVPGLLPGWHPAKAKIRHIFAHARKFLSPGCADLDSPPSPKI